MYPRLKLARNLLREDGVIFISIGEQEQHNLRKICDEIFGEKNFVGCAGRISKKANNQGDYWAPNFDYLLTYARNIEFCEPFYGGFNDSSYNLIEEDGDRKGERYQLIRLYMTSLDPLRGCKNQRYYIECPDGTFIIPPGENFPEEKKDGASIAPKTNKDKVWRWSLNSYLEKKDEIVVKEVKSSNLVDQDGNPAKWNVYTKTYLNDVKEKLTATPNNFIENHINQNSSHELKKLDIPFDFAKPTSLIKYLMEIVRVKKDDIILDFFSGSATTADATMQMNAEDNGNRKFVLVQLPEKYMSKDDNKYGFNTICDIGEERIRRAGCKIKEETNADIDYGFRVYKVDSSNMKDVYYTPTELKQEQLNMFESNIKEDRTSDDLLTQVILDLGLTLDLRIEEKKILDNNVYFIEQNSLVACFDDKIDINI